MMKPQEYELNVLENVGTRQKIEIVVNESPVAVLAAKAAIRLNGRKYQCQIDSETDGLTLLIPPLPPGWGYYDICVVLEQGQAEQKILCGRIKSHEKLTDCIVSIPEERELKIHISEERIVLSITNPDGPKGDTPVIGENGNWWISGKDTFVPAKTDLSNYVRRDDLDKKLETYAETFILPDGSPEHDENIREHNIYFTFN